MKLDAVVKELRKDNWLTGITFIEDNRDFLQALVDETEKQLIIPFVVGQSEQLPNVQCTVCGRTQEQMLKYKCTSSACPH
jgi:hypothetical protein